MKHLLLFSLFCSCLWADLPLLVEDLVSGDGNVRLETSLAYTNSHTQGVALGEPIIIQTSSTSFVALPSDFGENEQQNENLIGTLGLHYGLTSAADIYVRGSYLLGYRQQKGLESQTNEFEHKGIDSWIGVNYEFLKDDSVVGILGYLEAAIYEKNINKVSYFHSGQIGATIYKSIDPVVLVLNAAYRHSHKRKDKSGHYTPGDVLLLQPSVGFAANEWVTLSFGFQWLHQRASKFDDTKQGFHRSLVQPTFGVGYGFARGNILNLTFKAATQKDSNNDIMLHWAYTF